MIWASFEISLYFHIRKRSLCNSGSNVSYKRKSTFFLNLFGWELVKSLYLNVSGKIGPYFKVYHLIFQALKINLKSWESSFSNVIGSISKTFNASSFFLISR